MRPMALVLTLLRLLLWPVGAFVRKLRSRHPARYVFLKVPADLPQFSAARRWWERWRIGRGSGLVGQSSLEDLEALFQQAGGDSRVRGLVLVWSPLRCGWNVAGALRRSVLALRGQDKEVVVYLPKGGGDRDLYVATAADRVFVSPGSSLDLLGCATEQLYVPELLGRVGVGVQVNAQGDFKTAAERFVAQEMSSFQREQLVALLQSRQDLLCEGLAQKMGKEHSPAQLFEEVWLSPERAREVGLVDAACYEDALPRKLGQEALGARWAVTAQAYRGMHGQSPLRALRGGQVLARLDLRGMIREGAGRRAGIGGGIGLGDTVANLRSLAENRQVAGVLMCVDSPGGSALVSDLIHHEVVQLAARKPVVAFFGGVAASGGYYIAAPCQQIIASPETMTGSIGVVSMRVMIEELLRKLGVRSQVVQTAPHADMMRLTRGWTAEEMALVERESQRIYHRFLQVVTEGRQLDFEHVRSCAGGRVWTAVAAKERGLVDEVGDLDVALRTLRREAGDFPLKRVPHRAESGLVLPADEEPAGDLLGLLAGLPEPLGEWAMQAVAHLVGGGRPGPAERVLCFCPLAGQLR